LLLRVKSARLDQLEALISPGEPSQKMEDLSLTVIVRDYLANLDTVREHLRAILLS